MEALFVAVLPLVAACSSTTNNVSSNCGAGTVLVDGVCVAAQSDAAMDAVVSDAEDSSVPSTDSGASDSAVPTDSPAPSDATDSSTTDAPAGGWTPDPCPTTSYASCAKDCNGVAPYCTNTVSCPAKAANPWGSNPIVRIPAYVDAPVCDKFCTTSQTRGAYFHISVTKSSILRVGPPWAISAAPGTIGCPPAKAPSCIPILGENDYVIFTADPTAPARNVTITSATTDKCP